MNKLNSVINAIIGCIVAMTILICVVTTVSIPGIKKEIKKSCMLNGCYTAEVSILVSGYYRPQKLYGEDIKISNNLLLLKHGNSAEISFIPLSSVYFASYRPDKTPSVGEKRYVINVISPGNNDVIWTADTVEITDKLYILHSGDNQVLLNPQYINYMKQVW
jgi:hypothetical protein